MIRHAQLVLTVATILAIASHDASARGPRGGGRGPARGPGVGGGGRPVGGGQPIAPQSIRRPGVGPASQIGPGNGPYVNGRTPLPGERGRSPGLPNATRGVRPGEAVQPTPDQLRGFLGLPGEQGAARRTQQQAGVRSHDAAAMADQRRQQWQQHGDEVRTNLNHAWSHYWDNHPAPFTPSWYAQHPNAWQATHPYANGAAVAAWATTAAFVGAAGAAPMSYSYGSGGTVVYADGVVYVNEQPAGSAQQYAASAEELAATSADQEGNGELSSTQWMRLGMFAMTPTGTTRPMQVVELAVNERGVLRGNYVDLLSSQVSTVEGAVDKTTQRTAWRIGGNDVVVFETGLADLTEPQASILLHFGEQDREEWTLVRLENR